MTVGPPYAEPGALELGPPLQARAAHRFADLSRGRMHYVTAGTGRAILLLHGWPGYWYDYRHVIGPASSIARVVAPDYLGFGLSSPLPDDEIGSDEERFAEDLLELAEHLELDRMIVVGHDIGSAVAPAMARLASHRVRGLVLLNATHPLIGAKRDAPDAQREAWYQHFHVLPLAAQLIDGDRQRVSAYLGHFYRHWAGTTPIEPADFETIVDTYARPGAFRASLAWYRARAARRRRPSRPTPITTPTVALWGDRDPMRPLDHRAGFEETFPGSRSDVLPGVGHFVPAEAPEAVVAAISELL